MTEAPPWFSYTNLPERSSGPLLSVFSRLIPGVGRVQAQVGPYAQAWQAANLSALDGSRNPAAPLWVALGDSLSQGIGASAYDRGWVGQARETLARHGSPYRLVNLSVSGARTGEVLDRQLPALDALEALDALGRAPDLVTLLVGSNDIFSRARRESLPATFEALLERVPAGTVVATLPNPTRSAGEVNGVIQRVAGLRGLVVAETRRPQLQSWRGKLSDDHFHPNDLGYAGIAAIFTEAILRPIQGPLQGMA